MKTRKAETPKSAVKKSPPAKKSAVKTPSNPPESAATPNTSETKRVTTVKVRRVKKKEPQTPSTPVVDKPSADVAGASGDGVQVKSVKKVTPSSKLVVKRIAKKSKTPDSSKVLEEEEKVKDMDEGEKGKDMDDGENAKDMDVGENAKDMDVRENAKDMDEGENTDIQPVNVEKNIEVLQGTSQAGNREIEEHTDKVDLGEHRKELGEDIQEECAEETDTLEEECREISASAKERKVSTELEIFVGGLDQDAVEEDLKKVFEKIGEVVEVRLHKNSSGNNNNGYAFVKFAKEEHAKQALTEMKNPIICGKRCGTAPSEDDRTLFVGNICNTWTKEAIKKKLKHYKIEGVENITLVPDAEQEGLSRGFAFIGFTCHGDAMLAYKRLQKADVIFGHTERTVKVAIAEPLSEPDPEMMAQVKSVFVDGIPPQWDEAHIRDKLKVYGEITRIVLARNMSRAKRKDFGFVDFSTHEAAVACIHGLNNPEFGDRKKKTKVKARLLNPQPKTQAVKGGMSGGFRIGHSSGESSRSERGLGQGSTHFQRGRGFQHAEWGLSGRVGFPNNVLIDDLPLEFHGRQPIDIGGRLESFRGGHFDYGRSVGIAGLSRPIADGLWHGAPEGGFGFHASPRNLSYTTQREYERPFIGQHIDDPYLFDDNARGMKRPFSMIEPDYVEPSRYRPQLDYTDPEALFQGSYYRDGYRSGTNLYPHDYYGSYVGRGPYSSFHGGGGQTYRGGYYY